MVFLAIGMAKFTRSAPRVALLATLAASLGGCASQFPMFDGLFSASDPMITGSLTDVPPPFDQAMQREDWLVAEQSLESALDPSNLDLSTSWQHPPGHAKGSFRPAGSAFTKNGFLCRDFTGIVEKTSYQPQLFAATACRFGAGPWQVRATRPG